MGRAAARRADVDRAVDAARREQPVAATLAGRAAGEALERLIDMVDGKDLEQALGRGLDDRVAGAGRKQRLLHHTTQRLTHVSLRLAELETGKA